MNESKILFNEKCRVCNFEIKHYKKRSKLNFVDCSEMEDKYLKRLHVVFDNGEEISESEEEIEVFGCQYCGKEFETDFERRRKGDYSDDIGSTTNTNQGMSGVDRLQLKVKITTYKELKLKLTFQVIDKVNL